MGSGRYIDFDLCMKKIQSLAKADEYDRNEKQHKVQPPKEENKCTNCAMQRTCRKFKGKTAINGTYSTGGDADNVTVCDKWKPAQDKVKVSAQNAKCLLKQFSKQVNKGQQPKKR